MSNCKTWVKSNDNQVVNINLETDSKTFLKLNYYKHHSFFFAHINPSINLKTHSISNFKSCSICCISKPATFRLPLETHSLFSITFLDICIENASTPHPKSSTKTRTDNRRIFYPKTANFCNENATLNSAFYICNQFLCTHTAASLPK